MTLHIITTYANMIKKKEIALITEPTYMPKHILKIQLKPNKRER
jgi:hypothetical protein